ncbi:hypothetical protein CR513_30762, partial [Mucuna pruriens]
MVLGKISIEFGVHATATKWFNLAAKQLHNVQNLTDRVHKATLHHGDDWHHNESIKHWTCIIGGKVTTFEEIIESVDEPNKTITYNIFSEDIGRQYKAFKFILQVIDKDHDGAIIKWSIEYEGIDEEVNPPYDYIEFLHTSSRDCIGATTLDEYRKHVEKDPALERRFQPVKYRFLPDKAIDLIDKVGELQDREIDLKGEISTLVEKGKEMSKAESKISIEFGVHATATKWFNLLAKQLHDVQNLTERVHKAKLHHGDDWHDNESIKHWTSTIGYITYHESIESIDEPNKTMTYKVYGIDKDHGNTIIKWSIEYEGNGEEVDPPYGFIQYLYKSNRDIDGHLLKA